MALDLVSMWGYESFAKIERADPGGLLPFTAEKEEVETFGETWFGADQDPRLREWRSIRLGMAERE